MKGECVHSAAQGDVGCTLGMPSVSTRDAPGDGGGTSAAHVWAVLSGRCCKAGREEPEPGLWAALGQVLGCLDSLGSVLQERC